MLGESDAELSIFLCDDDAIHELNATYRDVDRATDVLAFAAREARTPGDTSGEFRGDKKVLGDVVISIQTAARQAVERGADQGHEIRYLLAHGILHLVGYDHATRAERRRMFAMTDVLVAATKCGYIASSRPEDSRRRR